MKKFLFSSDKHLGHYNIIRSCSRPFKSIEEMSQNIISKHNEIATENDELWDLGDFAFRCYPTYAVECLKQLKGTINLILGNHDLPIRKAYNKGLLDPLIKSGKVRIIGPTDNS